MWPFTRKEARTQPPIFFTNTLTGHKDVFAPLKAGVVTMYSCGPTVYSRAHIGNMRAYVFADTVARVLMKSGYHVRRVINITDVGHLVGDADDGEDKIAVGAKREQLSPIDIANRYASLFIEDIRALNIDTEHILFPRATEYIEEQIAMAKALEEKGLAYRIKDGLYFDTSKLPNYGKLGGVAEVKLMGGARIKIEEGKRNLHDFALWRTAKPGDLQQWNSPWGYGNPGWHIECSAMIKSLLGTEIDIHTGGMDHIAIHHNNEIAQSESVNGRPLARYWLHGAFLNIEGDKISKSLGNDLSVGQIAERGIQPLALRYLFLQAHYRSPITFSWEALEAADQGLGRLWRMADEVARESKRQAESGEALERFMSLVRDDLGTPQALAYLWEVLKDEELSAKQQWGVVEAADAVLGLSLLASPLSDRQKTLDEVPEDIRQLAQEREEARKRRDFLAADRLRKEIRNRGYRVDDSKNGPLFTPTKNDTLGE